jgi:hypothetical protein
MIAGSETWKKPANPRPPPEKRGEPEAIVKVRPGPAERAEGLGRSGLLG